MYVYQNTGASLWALAPKIAWNHKAPYLTLFVTLCVELGPFHNVLDVDGPCGGSIQLQAAPIHTQWRGGGAHRRVLITAAMTPSRKWCFSHLQRYICIVLPNLLTQFQWDTGAGIHQCFEVSMDRVCFHWLPCLPGAMNQSLRGVLM